MSYYQHQYVSNSDLKSLRQKLGIDPATETNNLEEIFDLGTLIHQCLLEPHKVDLNHKELDLAKTMAKTVMKDHLCREFILMPDFRREHEFYRKNIHGVPARAKSDGDSKMLSAGLEYKGLSVTSHKAFLDAIQTFNYDQGLAWYMDVTGYKMFLIVAVSKKHPDRIFKELVDRNHKFYERGRIKAELATKTWTDFFGSRAFGVPEEESFYI